MGGRFPPNYPVGRITSIERAAGESFATVLAEPVAHLDRSREVLLVWHKLQVKDVEVAGSSKDATGTEKK